MPGDESRNDWPREQIIGSISAAARGLMKCGEQRQARRDDGWLRIDRLAQRLVWPLEAERREREAQGGVGGFIYSMCGRRGREDILAHADALAALAREDKCDALAHTLLRLRHTISALLDESLIRRRAPP